MMELFSAWLFQNITNLWKHPVWCGPLKVPRKEQLPMFNLLQQHQSTFHNKNKYKGIEVHRCLVDNLKPKFIVRNAVGDKQLRDMNKLLNSQNPLNNQVYDTIQVHSGGALSLLIMFLLGGFVFPKALGKPRTIILEVEAKEQSNRLGAMRKAESKKLNRCK